MLAATPQRTADSAMPKLPRRCLDEARRVANNQAAKGRPVRSGRRAREVHYKQKAEEYDIRGTAEFVARVKAELNKCRLK